MSILTMRGAFSRHKTQLTRWMTGAALFASAGVAVVETTTHPSGTVIRPAAAAVTAAVTATRLPQPALSYLSGAAAASPVKAPSPTPSWELANIANPRVNEWVKRFTTSLKQDFAAALSRGTAYEAMISQKLAARKMPQELIYLAMIESEFKPTARSPVSAVGLWQFMAGTARQFGLTVGGGSDDRTNPAKETDAALTYLAQLHDRFGSWYLAAAAYNAGPGAVASALKQTTGSSTGSDADFYRIAPHLPAETRDYVPKLIAAARVGKSVSGS